MNENKLDQKTVAEECAKVAARLVESVSRTAQLSSLATPQMQEMFGEWIEIIGRQVIRGQELPGRVDVAHTAKEIGISRSTLLGVLLYLHRQGSISITDVGVGKGSDCNEDICSCMKGE
ncbi:MAG: hypothetical protein Q7I97_02940 [Thermovirgaceae bacterium]|nr:hypothetical protein [Thermovirgaceae bacterium]